MKHPFSSNKNWFFHETTKMLTHFPFGKISSMNVCMYEWMNEWKDPSMLICGFVFVDLLLYLNVIFNGFLTRKLFGIFYLVDNFENLINLFTFQSFFFVIMHLAVRIVNQTARQRQNVLLDMLFNFITK